MPDFGEMHLEAALGAALERAGYRAEDAALRELLPTAARGHNVAVVSPPAAVYAMPAVAAALSAAAGGENPGPRLLILCAESALDEWQASLGSLLRGTDVRVHVARGIARAARRLRQGELDLLVVTPGTALALMERSALKTDALPALFLAWPETWEDVERITPLMQDLPQDAQRIIYTGNPDGSRELVDRYARKALRLGYPEADDAASPKPEPRTPNPGIRTVLVPWSQRAQAVAGAVEILDPSQPVVWTAWPSTGGALLPLDAGIEMVSGGAPEGDAVIACDLPDAGRLGQLAAAGPVVLLVPPHGREWVSRIAPAALRNPLRLPDAGSAAAAGAGQRRGEIRELIEAGELEGAHLALAPLFDRYDATTVAAALYRLWTEARGRATARDLAPGVPAPAARAGTAPGSSTARIWVGVGRKDGATANDLVGTLTREVGVDRQKIGKVEIRELYTLVEVPAPEAENIARSLMGRTIRRRRVAARLDRGATRRE